MKKLNGEIGSVETYVKSQKNLGKSDGYSLTVNIVEIQGGQSYSVDGKGEGGSYKYYSQKSQYELVAVIYNPNSEKKCGQVRKKLPYVTLHEGTIGV